MCNIYTNAGGKNNQYAVKPVLSGHSKIDKTKVLIINGSLRKVECIAVEHSAIISTCVKRQSALKHVFFSF